MLLPVLDESTINSFDEFFDNELYQLQNDSKSRQSLHSPEGYSSQGLVTEYGLVDSSPTRADLRQKLQQESHPLTQRSEILVEKTRKSRDQTFLVSPRDVESNDYVMQTDLLSNNAGYRMRPERGQANDQHTQHDFRFDREKTLSPTPAYQRISPDGSDFYIDSWQQDFQDFHLESAVDNGLTEKEGQKVYGGSISHNAGFTSDRGWAHASQMPTRYHYPFQTTIQVGSEQPPTSISAGALPEFLLYGTPNYQPATDMKISRSSDGSQNSSLSYGSLISSIEIGNSSQRPTLRSCKSTGNFHKGSTGRIIAPLPRGKAHNMINQHYDFSANGLGIHYPLPDEIGCAIPYTPLETIEHPTQAIPLSQSDNPFTIYPPLPPVPVDPTFDRYSTRHRRHQSLSCSPSPPLSTMYPTLHRNSQHNSPSRLDRTRRKSIHRIGPLKETAAKCDSGSSPTHSRSRNRSASRSRSSHNRTRSTSSKPAKPNKHSSNPVTATTTPTNVTFDFDFVNYTAQDSEKLMSDVAPSGSSKTRARREQEARDRRKKFNEAAIIAVRKAGGNVKDLQHRLVS